jgi:hypothetical protein
MECEQTKTKRARGERGALLSYRNTDTTGVQSRMGVKYQTIKLKERERERERDSFLKFVEGCFLLVLAQGKGRAHTWLGWRDSTLT